MARLSVTQLRSGEGWILTTLSRHGPEAVAAELPDLLVGPLLAGSESKPPAEGRPLGENLWAFEGDQAKRVLETLPRWAGKGAIVAAVRELPDDDARRRFIPDALRPWDAERLGATFYAQVGSRYHVRGAWFARERDRMRFVEIAFRRLAQAAGVRLPNGDVTIVFELPTDSTFEAVFQVSGSGDALRLSRRFPARGLERTWRIVKGEWEAEERRGLRPGAAGVGRSLGQKLASASIVVLSVPVFLLVGAVALFTRLFGGTTASSSAQPRVTRSK
jgi:hypothetical protein